MHPISDKELDKLFKQRFEDAEFQPSADVWGKIAVKMDQKTKVKKTFPVFWMAAASVIVVLGASLWFYRPVEMIKLQGNGQEQEMVQNTHQSPISDLGTGAAVLDPYQPEINGFDFSKLVSVEEPVSNQATALVPEKSSDELSGQEVIVLVNAAKRNSQDLAQLRKDVSVPRYTGDQSQLDVTQADMIANTEVSKEEILVEQEHLAPKRIRSVGSLVNFVISKVDRREDKIIEFKDGDEGSEVSGINLGLIKLKSRNK